MGNILATVISYDQTDVYVFKDTNNVINTLCRIKFMEVESVPSTAATDWDIISTTNALNASKYDVTLEYRPVSLGGTLTDFVLPVYDSVITNNTLLTTFIPLAFILNSSTVIATPNKANETFTVTIVDTIAIIIDTEEFDNAIFRVTTTETEIYGYIRDQSGNDVAVTENESVAAISKNFDNQNRLELTSITLTKGRWLVEATGSFDCSAATQVHFWFDIGGLLNELTLVPQYRDSLRTFNSQSNSNMSITMQSEFFFDDSIRLYWCTTPDTIITSSIFSTNIPTPSIANPFINHAIGNSGTNNAKITAISLSGV